MFQVKWSSRNTPGRWKYLRYFAFIIKRRSLISLVWLCNMRNDQSGSSLNSVIWRGEHLSDQPRAAERIPTASHSNRTNLPCFPEDKLLRLDFISVFFRPCHCWHRQSKTKSTVPELQKQFLDNKESLMVFNCLCRLCYFTAVPMS